MRIENADKASAPAAYIWLTLVEAAELRDALDDLLREPQTQSDWHAHVWSSDYQTVVTVAYDAG